MVRNLFLTTLCALAFCPAFAQTSTMEGKVEYGKDKYKVETNRLWSNWFISAGGDAQIYFGDHGKQISFGKRLAPVLDTAMGKWFTPEVGMRLMYSDFQQKGTIRRGTLSYSVGGDIPGKGGNGYWLERQRLDMVNFYADILSNFSNLFCGYNERRIWNYSPYAGLGWTRIWKSPSVKEVDANVGILNSFRLCNALDLNLDTRAMLVNDRPSDEGGGHFNEGMLSATVELAYKFKPHGWDRSKTTYRYDCGDLESMCRKLNGVSVENERLKRILAESNVQDARTIIRKIVAANLVIFPIDKSGLDNEARVNLGMSVEIIKSGNPEATYTIIGYTDMGIGSKKDNEKLSKEYAYAVYGCLVKEFDVKKSQLRTDYKGDVENMSYNDPCLSHAIIIRNE